MRHLAHTAMALILAVSTAFVASSVFAAPTPPVIWDTQFNNEFIIGSRFLDLVPLGDGSVVGAGEYRAYDPYATASSILVGKVDPSGDELWTSMIYSQVGDFKTYNEILGGIEPAADGGFYVAANVHSYGTTPELPYGGDAVSDTFHNAYLVKLNADGEEQWRHFYNPLDIGYVVDVLATDDGGLLLLGCARKGGYRGILMKVDSLGEPQWVQTFQEYIWFYMGSKVIATSDGGYFIASIGTNFYHLMLRKLTQDGRVEWERDVSEPWVEKRVWDVTETAGGDFRVASEYDPYEGDSSNLLYDVDSKGKNITYTVFDTDLRLAYRALFTSDGGVLFNFGKSLLKLGANDKEQWRLQFDFVDSWVSYKYVFDMYEGVGGIFLAGNDLHPDLEVPTDRPYQNSLRAQANIWKLDHLGIDDTGAGYPPDGTPGELTVEVLQGGKSNVVELSMSGLINVAIHSDESFDATDIDPTTALFATAPVEGCGKSSGIHASGRDVNGDGFLDLILSFRADGIDTSAAPELFAETWAGETVSGVANVTWRTKR